MVKLDTRGKIIIVFIALLIWVPTLTRGVYGMVSAPRDLLDYVYLTIGILALFFMLAFLSVFFRYDKTDATYSDYE